MNPTAPEQQGQGPGGRDSNLAGDGGGEGEEADERRSMPGRNRERGSEQFGGNDDSRNWNMNTEYGGPGPARGGGSESRNTHNFNQDHAEENWSNPMFGGQQGDSQVQVAAFGAQGPRGGGTNLD